MKDDDVDVAHKHDRASRPSRYRKGCCSRRHLCPRHAEIARRYRKPRLSFDEHRVNDIDTVIARKFDGVLPANEKGAAYVFALANYMIEPATKLIDAKRL
jgi:hypothetical protein